MTHGHDTDDGPGDRPVRPPIGGQPSPGRGPGAEHDADRDGGAASSPAAVQHASRSRSAAWTTSPLAGTARRKTPPHHYLTTRLALEAITGIETTPVLRTLKAAGPSP